MSYPGEVPLIRLSDSANIERELLLDLQQAVLAQPQAAQGIYRCLVAEGRHYARTPAGAEKLEQLRNSSLIQRARLALELSTAWMLDEDGAGSTPSNILNALFMAADGQELEPMLGDMYGEDSS